MKLFLVVISLLISSFSFAGNLLTITAQDEVNLSYTQNGQVVRVSTEANGLLVEAQTGSCLIPRSLIISNNRTDGEVKAALEMRNTILECHYSAAGKLKRLFLNMFDRSTGTTLVLKGSDLDTY